MPVLILWVVAVDDPLLQLSVASYLHRRQVAECGTHLDEEVGVALMEYLRCLESGVEYIEDNLVVHR